MNRHRLSILATLLEMAIKPKAEPKIGFNMIHFVNTNYPDKTQHHCGTTACIAGWAVLAFSETSDNELSNMDERRIEADATAELDLTNEEAYKLFIPGSLDLNNISPKQAIRVLRHAARTGKIDWDKRGDV